MNQITSLIRDDFAPTVLQSLAVPSSPGQRVLTALSGLFPFPDGDLDAVLHEACRIAAAGVQADFAKVLQYRADEQAFVLQAGFGWPASMVGRARFAADPGTAAGFAWRAGQPVILNHSVGNERYRVPQVLTGRSIRKTISVPIRGAGAEAFGVIEVGGAKPGRFDRHDVAFLQALAARLAASIDRQARQAAQEDLVALAEAQRSFLSDLRHRVRNELQGMDGPADLRTRRRADPRRGALPDQDTHQPKAFASVGGRQPGGPPVTSIDLGAYLHMVCGKIAQAKDLRTQRVALSTDLRPVLLDPRAAAHFAVAVHELVADAARRAFLDRSGGTITVSLRPSGDGTAALTVADDGQGAAPCRGGDAIGLVQRIVRHAGGELSRSDADGTAWTMTMRTAEDPARPSVNSLRRSAPTRAGAV